MRSGSATICERNSLWKIFTKRLISKPIAKPASIRISKEEWDHAMDNIYFDEGTGQLMQSVTIPGGDVIQIPYEGEDDN